MKKNWKFTTKAVHIGSEIDETTGAVIPPIYQTSTFAQKSPGEHQGYEYTRSHNPTRTRLENCLASLENAKYALVTASGLSATDLILHSLPQNSSVLSDNDLYGGTFRQFETVYKEKLNFSYLDMCDLAQVKQAIIEKQPALIWLESLTNPTLKICDFRKIADIKKDALVVVDNTMLSPYFCNPLDLGADIVIHSATKFINGHSDVVVGALMTNNQEIYDKLFYLQNAVGPCQSPFDSWLVLRGVKTLALRMEKSQENAIKIAEYLQTHPKVEKTIYPALVSHPQHILAKEMLGGFGSMVSFFLKGGLKESRQFLSNCKLFALAESLGGVESLIEHPAIMTHASIPKAQREKLGISDNFIRISVGIEDLEDLIEDLESAFKTI